MGRSMIGFGAFLGVTVGSFVPELWGSGSLSLASVAFGLLGGVAGVWAGARFAEL
jgi:hypothetical protein